MFKNITKNARMPVKIDIIFRVLSLIKRERNVVTTNKSRIGILYNW